MTVQGLSTIAHRQSQLQGARKQDAADMAPRRRAGWDEPRERTLPSHGQHRQQ